MSSFHTSFAGHARNPEFSPWFVQVWNEANFIQVSKRKNVSKGVNVWALTVTDVNFEETLAIRKKNANEGYGTDTQFSLFISEEMAV